MGPRGQRSAIGGERQAHHGGPVAPQPGPLPPRREVPEEDLGIEVTRRGQEMAVGGGGQAIDPADRRTQWMPRAAGFEVVQQDIRFDTSHRQPPAVGRGRQGQGITAVVQEGGGAHTARGVPQGHAPVELEGRDRLAVGGEGDSPDDAVPDPPDPSDRHRFARRIGGGQPGQDGECQEEQADPPAAPPGQPSGPDPGSPRPLLDGPGHGADVGRFASHGSTCLSRSLPVRSQGAQGAPRSSEQHGCSLSRFGAFHSRRSGAADRSDPDRSGPASILQQGFFALPWVSLSGSLASISARRPPNSGSWSALKRSTVQAAHPASAVLGPTRQRGLVGALRTSAVRASTGSAACPEGGSGGISQSRSRAASPWRSWRRSHNAITL